eukprot:6879657-Pyramimonas_sp.AAC.1
MAVLCSVPSGHPSAFFALGAVTDRLAAPPRPCLCASRRGRVVHGAAVPPVPMSAAFVGMASVSEGLRATPWSNLF